MKIAANGISMKYELSGTEEGEVVLLSHSLGSTLSMWDKQVPVLNENFRVLRFDTRGHGGTDAPEGPYTLEQLGKDAIALMDALEIEKVHWVGISMGGMIGQVVALDSGARLKSLVLCDTAAVIPREAQPVWEERISRARREGLGSLVQETMERWFTPGYLNQSPAEVEKIRELFLATSVSGFVGCSEAIRRLNTLDALSRINTRTLIMVGEEDPGTPVEASKAIKERIPGAELIVIPSAAHLSNVEQSGVFNENLLRFLSRA